MAFDDLVTIDMYNVFLYEHVCWPPLISFDHKFETTSYSRE
jgi:hypothetical protein